MFFNALLFSSISHIGVYRLFRCMKLAWNSNPCLFVLEAPCPFHLYKIDESSPEILTMICRFYKMILHLFFRQEDGSYSRKDRYKTYDFYSFGMR